MTDPKFIGPPKKLFKSYTMPEAKTATEIGKDIMKKTNVGAGKVLTALGSPIRTTKKILSKVKSKFTATAAKAKDATKGAVLNLRRPGKAKIFTRAGKTTTGLGKQNPFVAQFKKTPKTARVASKALRVAKFARAATPIGLATVAVTSIKKRDPKAVKRERDFYKGKKYKDVGFESMLNYNKGGLKTIKMKSGKLAIRDFLRSKFKSQDRVMNKGKQGATPGAVFMKLKKMGLFKEGGLKMATEKLKAKGYRYGTMAKGNVKEGIKKSAEQAVKLEDFRKSAIKKIRGAQVGPLEEKRISNFFPSIKDSVEVRKQKMDKVKQMISKFNTGGANLKKIPEGPKGEGLRKLKAKRPDVTRKMGFAKKGKVMKAMAGKSVRGYGAARTSGMGLQDEQMVPGKSMEYYKDLM